MKNKPEHLYIHVPFCRSICFYCDFCHQVYNHGLAEDWLKALKLDFEAACINEKCKTIYIGGGTPTSLELNELDQLLDLIDPYTGNVEEYTIEINPETFSEEKCRCMVSHGVNRASIGFQTHDEQLLKNIGRHHSEKDVAETIEILQRNGISNISLDLMYSLPNQTLESFQTSVKHVLMLHPTHLSLYSLTVEENTVFGKKQISSADEDTEADMYEWICNYLPQNNFSQYEVSNFCISGYESKHNLAYWHYHDFYGLSAGASGKENHHRYDKTRILSEYIWNPKERKIIELSVEDEMFEMIMMGLRLKKGISKAEFRGRFGAEIEDKFRDQIMELSDRGLLVNNEDNICCSGKGFPILNTVLEVFIPD